jgi:Thioredoxin
VFALCPHLYLQYYSPILPTLFLNSQHEDDPQSMLADSVNERLTRAMNELKVKHASGTNEVDHPDRAPTGSSYQTMSQQHHMRQTQQQVVPLVTPRSQTRDEGNNNDDEDYDWLLDEDVDADGDDPVLQALRERRLAELKRECDKKAADLARGHGQVRTIAQDEFLPECTGTSEWVAVHFYHKEFHRCTVMDHHLKIVAVKHTECKFLRIDAEKAPFFVHKLQIKTLPTLLVLRNGNVVDRLIGFEGLQTSAATIKQYRHFAEKKEIDPDQWKTSELQKWLTNSGAITYTDEVEEEESEIRRQRIKGCMFRGGVRDSEDDGY